MLWNEGETINSRLEKWIEVVKSHWGKRITNKHPLEEKRVRKSRKDEGLETGRSCRMYLLSIKCTNQQN